MTEKFTGATDLTDYLLVIAIMVLLFVAYLATRVLSQEKIFKGKVVRKEEQDVQNVFDSFPFDSPVPPPSRKDYLITIAVENNIKIFMPVAPDLYSALKEGDEVKVIYRIGPITGIIDLNHGRTIAMLREQYM